MTATYEDLLSGDYILMSGVGHFRSPLLKEMRPSGIGWPMYNTYVYIIKSNRDELMVLSSDSQSSDSLYTTIINNDQLREFYRAALDFFMLETVLYDPENRKFITIEATPQDDESVDIKLIGEINGENLDDVRELILCLNYISPKKTDINMKFASKAAEEAWLQIQKYQKNNEKKPDDTHSIGNFISKLCAIHPSYNYFNVYELTIFQFYDAFFQSAYMKSFSFSEAIVSNHGSDSFDFNDWMKPVQN